MSLLVQELLLVQMSYVGSSAGAVVSYRVLFRVALRFCFYCSAWLVLYGVAMNVPNDNVQARAPSARGNEPASA